MSKYHHTYLLDKRGRPYPVSDLVAWGKGMKAVNRQVAYTTVSKDILETPTIGVSTVFLGLNHQFGEGKPVLYETLIQGGVHDGKITRYSTRKEAKRGHRKAIRLAKEDNFA